VKLSLAGGASAVLISMALQGCIGVSSNLDMHYSVEDSVQVTQSGDQKVFEYEKHLMQEHNAVIDENKTNNYDYLDFEIMDYRGKSYLTLNKEDMLSLIKQAMLELDDEYIDNGATSVFSITDTVYSHFTPEHIYGLMSTETDFRILEIKDKNKGVYKTSNYKSFHGESKGIIYHGLGMMSEKTLNYIIETDRHNVNRFENYDSIKVGDKSIKLTFDNLDAYKYVLSSGAKTESEIKKALSENIVLNVKCIYSYLNELVKYYVRDGKHDIEFNKLSSYKKLNKMTAEEKQIFFALLSYNQGPNLTINSMLDGSLFDKNEKGEYINNIKYPVEVMNRAKEVKNSLQLQQ